MGIKRYYYRGSIDDAKEEQRVPALLAEVILFHGGLYGDIMKKIETTPKGPCTQ